MSIIGVGTDIVKVARIAEMCKKHESRFLKRILHDNEILVFSEKNDPIPYLAKRFAAKEATAKALGIGIAKGISFNDIEVFNKIDGKPELVLHGKAQDYAKKLGVKKTFISLSDEKKYAIAYVILES